MPLPYATFADIPIGTTIRYQTYNHGDPSRFIGGIVVDRSVIPKSFQGSIVHSIYTTILNQYGELEEHYCDDQSNYNHNLHGKFYATI